MTIFDFISLTLRALHMLYCVYVLLLYNQLHTDTHKMFSNTYSGMPSNQRAKPQKKCARTLIHTLFIALSLTHIQLSKFCE